MKKADIDTFEKINAQLIALQQELSQLVKKSPDNPINKFKLKIINVLLQNSNTILGEKYKPLLDFIDFNEDDLPTNSDVAIIIAQYLNCMEKLRADNIQQSTRIVWQWKIDDSKEIIRTAPPEKIERRK
jgi:hypothetical protein